jgi:hypothetical protein
MAGGKKRGPKQRPPFPTEWRIIRGVKDGKPWGDVLRPPDIFELVELRLAVLGNGEVRSLLGETNFHTLMRLMDWQHHQLSPPSSWLDQEVIDAARWAAFRNGVKEKGWGDAGYDAARYATQQLKDTPFAAGPDQMRKSYNKMQRWLVPLGTGSAFRVSLSPRRPPG